ncbi:hypothetical protein [Mucilaginibacter lappiensis]|uniref:hypothetical protein n=1 Tax=Mucilaginibacter lappiensis TaxID=354630 RepID=UPI003D221FE1
MAKAHLLTLYPLAKANGNEKLHKKQTIHCRPIYGADKSKKGKGFSQIRLIGASPLCLASPNPLQRRGLYLANNYLLFFSPSPLEKGWDEA